MRDRMHAGRKGHTRTAALLGVALLLAAAPARAEEGSDPFAFLKPWIEKQIFGKETPQGGASDAAPSGPSEPQDGTALRDTPAATSAETPAAGMPAENPLTGALPEGGAGPAAEGASPDLSGEAAQEPSPAETDDVDAASVEGPEEVSIPPAEEAKPEPLRFGLLAGRSAVRTMAATAPVADDLARLLGRGVEFLPFPSYGAMIDAQVERRIDGGFYSAPAFAVAESRCGCIEPLVAPRAADGTLAYYAVVVARAGSDIRTLADLAGRTVAVGAADSIGARRMQLAGLMAEGFDPSSLGKVLDMGSAERAVGAVLSGEADAAFAWSSLAGDAAAGYSRGTLAALAVGGAATDGLAVIWRSPAIGHGPFALLSTVADSDKRTIETYLTALATANPEVYDGLDRLYGGGYAAVSARDYAGAAMLATQDVDAVQMPLAARARPSAAPAEDATTSD